MNHTLKKVYTLLMGLLVALSVSVPSFALDADGISNTTGGSFTVTGLSSGDEVKIYQVATNTRNSKNELTKAWVAGSQITDSDLESGHTLANVREFSAAEANTIAYKAQKNLTSATQSATATGDSVTFSTLPAGLYYVNVRRSGDVSTFFQPVLVPVNLEVKNGQWDYAEPVSLALKTQDVTPSKSSKSTSASDYSAGNNWSISTGDTVNYKVVVPVPNYNPNATNRVLKLHDTMSQGLKFDKNSVMVNGTALPANKITVTGSDTDASGTRITLDLSQYASGATLGTNLNVTYNAQLTGTTRGDFTNNVKSEYSVDNTSTTTTTTPDPGPSDPGRTTVKTGEVVIHKKSAQDQSALSGAHFQLIVNGHTYESTEKEGEAGTYTFAVALATNVSYTLKETEAPAGFKAVADQTGTTSFSEGTQTLTLEIEDPVADELAGILPKTGSTGTILITIVGVSIIAFGAIAMLKMRNDQ